MNANFAYLANCYATLQSNTFTGVQILNADPTTSLGAATKQYVDTHGGGGGSSIPQGRLTLLTVTPVMASNQTGKTTIYYTPYTGNQMPIYNGTSFASASFAELSNITTNSSTGNAGPAAVAANSNYDLFVWLNGTTATLTRGPAWTSDTARGTGTGTTELQRINGIWTNKNAITNGPECEPRFICGNRAVQRLFPNRLEYRPDACCWWQHRFLERIQCLQPSANQYCIAG